MDELYRLIWEGLPKKKCVALFVVAKDQSLIRNLCCEQNSRKLMAKKKKIDFLLKPKAKWCKCDLTNNEASAVYCHATQ